MPGSASHCNLCLCTGCIPCTNAPTCICYVCRAFRQDASILLHHHCSSVFQCPVMRLVVFEASNEDVRQAVRASFAAPVFETTPLCTSSLEMVAPDPVSEPPSPCSPVESSSDEAVAPSVIATKKRGRPKGSGNANSNAAIKRTKVSYKKKLDMWNHLVGPTERMGQCAACGELIQMESAECGHIVADAKGGSVELSNLMPVCRPCNKSMGTKHMLSWIKEQCYSRDIFDGYMAKNQPKDCCSHSVLPSPPLPPLVC